VEACDCSKANGPQLSGVAYTRGWFNAERIAGSRIGARWRNTREQSLLAAREILVDIERHDEGVIAKLVEHVGKGAADRWRSGR
jgi:hypothetical protein